jgi:hypothetical protein
MLIATISTQRSGTKLLSQCFNAGTLVSSFGEVFNPDGFQIGGFRDFLEAKSREICKGHDGFLKAYFEQFEHIRRIFAVDMMFNQLEIPTVTWNPHPNFGYFGYLQAVGAVVISLERDPFDSFISMKFLQNAGGVAHRYSEADKFGDLTEVLTLDEAELVQYRDRVLWHRANLIATMAGNPYFYRLHYNTLAQTLAIPSDLRDLICQRAAEMGIAANPNEVQLQPPRILPSNVDYTRVFENYSEMRAKFPPADGEFDPGVNRR